MTPTIPHFPWRKSLRVTLALLTALVTVLSAAFSLRAQDDTVPARAPLVWPPDPRIELSAAGVEAGAPDDAPSAYAPDQMPDQMPDQESPIPAASNYGAWTRMAFIRGSGDRAELYVANGDGANMVALTRNDMGESDPALSPDGTRIAFVADYDDNKSVSIYLINVDGTGMTPLIHGGGNHYNPAWSSDGRYLAYSSSRSGNSEIWVRDFFTGADIQFTYNGAPDIDPAFQPGSNKLFWVRAVNQTQGVLMRGELGTGGEMLVTDPLYFPGGTSVSPTGTVAYHFMEDPAVRGPWYSVGYTLPDNNYRTQMVLQGVQGVDYLVDGWAPVAQLPDSTVLIVNAVGFEVVDRQWVHTSGSIFLWDGEATRIPFSSMFVTGGFNTASSTQGLDKTPPMAWTKSAPRRITGLEPEDFRPIAWAGSDTQSNVAGYRFHNQGFDPVWVTETNATDAGSIPYRIHTCGANQYAVQALDWAGNWSPISPTRTVTFGNRVEVNILDARNVPIVGAFIAGYPISQSPASDGNGLFGGDFCNIAPGEAFTFEKSGYEHLHRDFWYVRGRSTAIMHTQAQRLDWGDGHPWQAEGAWVSNYCQFVGACSIPGMTLGRVPDEAISQRSKSSLSTTIALTQSIPLHEPTLNFMLAMNGTAGTTNNFVLTAQAQDDVEPTVLWQRRASNLSPVNIWIDLDDWQGKVFTMTYALTTEFGEPLSLVIIDRPTISAWMTPRIDTLTIGPAEPTFAEATFAEATAANTASADANTIDATSLITITGANFGELVYVAIGTATATVISSTATTIVAAAPAALEPGLHDVTVGSNGYRRTLPGAFSVGLQRWLPIVRFD